ncbi:MAG: O-antigen ligase family protein, partial [bacterium]|nr:O-antigen ligase family protein [bacterium]
MGVCLLSPLPAQFTDLGGQRFDEKKSNITTSVTSVFRPGGDRGRLAMWSNTLDMIADHPFLGVGLGAWKRYYPRYDQGAMVRRNSAPVRPHNDFLWVAAEFGLIGLALYLTFLAAILIALYRQSFNSSITLQSTLFAMSILAILGHSLFSFPKEQPQSAMLLFALGAIAIQSQGRKNLSRRSGLGLAILISLQSGAAGVLCYRHIQFDRHYYHALVAEDRGDWQEIEARVQKGLFYGDYKSQVIITSGRVEETMNRYESAERAYGRALDLSPYDWHAHNGLGIIFKRQDRFEDAERQYLEALLYFPGEDNSDSFGIRTNLGALYKSMGKLKKAETEYRKILAVDPAHAGANNNMGNFYKATGQSDSARVAYLKAIDADSSLVQAHFNIADLYLQNDQPIEALRHAEIAARLQPDEARIIWGLGLAL